MTLPYSFSTGTEWNTAWLDANFAALGALTAIPCGVAGTNTITMTPNANAPQILAYANYQPFSGIAGASNSGPATVQIGSLGLLPIYKDTAAGPAVLNGGEIVAGCLFVITYDSALNGGGGGFHLFVGSLIPAPVLGGVTSISSATGVTLTAAQLTASGGQQGIFLRAGSPTGAITDTADTAAAILGELPAAVVGTVFNFRVVNTSGETVTLGAGTGVTLEGSVTTTTGASHSYLGLVTALSPAAISIFG